MRSIEEPNVLMQLSIGLYFTPFISIVILRLGLDGSGDSDAVFSFLLQSGKLNRCRNLRGPFTLFFDFDGSEVVDYNPAVVVLFIGSLI